MVLVRCPNCHHTWKTDRGKIVHKYEGSTPEQIRLAREALAAAQYEVPLPLAVVDDQTPPWLLSLGLQGHLGELVERLAHDMGEEP